MLWRDMYWLGKDKTRFGPPYQFQLGFPRGSVRKNLPAIVGDAGDVGLIPGLGRSSRGGNGNPLQFLAWRILWTEEPGWATVHGVTKSGTQLSTHAKKAPVWAKSSLHASGGLRFLAENFLLVKSMKVTKRFPGKSVFLVFKSLRLAA